jgi:hypothetical protein
LFEEIFLVQSLGKRCEKCSKIRTLTSCMLPKQKTVLKFKHIFKNRTYFLVFVLAMKKNITASYDKAIFLIDKGSQNIASKFYWTILLFEPFFNRFVRSIFGLSCEGL